MKPFLEVLDNLERGLAQFEEGDPHRQGMEMICKQFMTCLLYTSGDGGGLYRLGVGNGPPVR